MKIIFNNVILFSAVLIFCFQPKYFGQQNIQNYTVTKGLYFPSLTPEGTFVKVLVIFTEFPDDEYNPDFTQWKKGSAPIFMGEKFIDSTINENSNVGNITQFFKEMSLNKFNIIGKTIYVKTPHSRKWYLENKKNRSFINADILSKVDSLIDFKEYDNWTIKSNNYFISSPDGKVDMVWIVFRNISNDMNDPMLYAAKLGFGTYVKKDRVQKWSGEASLGYGPTLSVDNWKRNINMGFVNGGGINIMEGYNGLKKIKNLCIHEFGHHLLGNNGMHGGVGFWAIMAGYGSRSNCANSFERVRLGWTNFIDLDTINTDTISLKDYATTGECLKISLPGTDPKEYYLLENHQNISSFDITNGKGNGKGLYIIHQTGPYNSNLNLVSANGKWQWKFDHKIANPWGSGEIPVFERSTPDPINGYFDNQRIPYFDSTENKNESSLVYAYIDPFTKKDTINPLFSGIGKDQFNLENNNVIGPWSNPRVLTSNYSVSNLAIEVLSDSNGIIKIKFNKGEDLYKDFPPSKPLALKAEFIEGKNIKIKFFPDDEPNINHYEIFRKSESVSEFKLIAKIKNENINKTKSILSWIDKKSKNSSGIVSYKIRAVNDKNIKSVFSDECKIKIGEHKSVKRLKDMK